MEFKLKSLYAKVYRAFIKGEYGEVKIPNKNEVLNKISELTSLDPTPILVNEKKEKLDINFISEQFNKAIDDIDVLFDSIELESQEILDQLTNSLKEHNGVKRELKQLNSELQSISAGQLTNDNLSYCFYETFDSLKNIDTFRSSPVDVEAGEFSIKRNSSRVVSLDHYKGKKLDFSVVQNFARLEEYGYIGSLDAGNILDPFNPKDITYRIKTNKPTPLRVITSIQLRADGAAIEINGITLDIDSRTNRGQIRIYYRGSNAAWKDITPIAIQTIKGDKIRFGFDKVSTSHIKIEFIKAYPDVLDTNEYFITIRSLAIYSSTNIISSVLQSKPIILKPYGNDIPVIEKIKVTADTDLPPGTSMKVYVAEDIKISGQFLDSNGNEVDPNSPNIFRFNLSGTGYEFLSDILSKSDSISGCQQFKGQDYDWKEVEVYESTGTTVPKEIVFITSDKVENIDNSIFQKSSFTYKFGDQDYAGIYPATSGGTWYIQGWCNSSNTFWDSHLKTLVESGILVSGVDVATTLGIAYDDIQDALGNLHPSIAASPLYSGQWLGWPSGYSKKPGYIFDNNDLPDTDDNSTIKFGAYSTSINGWWRPYVDSVTCTGLHTDYIDENGALLEQYNIDVPDFYFNGSNFWKIYKFGTTDNVIIPSIKLYTFQESPVFGDNVSYPYTFVWKYKTSWENKTGIKLDRTATGTYTTFSGYTIDLSGFINANEDYIFGGITEIRVHNTNVILDSQDYSIRPASSVPTGIDLTRLVTTRPNLVPEGTSFDVRYSYKVKNNYQSTWTGYVIVSPSATSPAITIPNAKIINQNDKYIISKIDIEDLDSGTTETHNYTSDIFNITFNADAFGGTDRHYKITIYCASDEDTGFCAKVSSSTPWIPYHSLTSKTIDVSQGLKIVSSLVPLYVVDVGSLIYDQTSASYRKSALYTDLNGEKYLIVKQPAKNSFPGYLYDSIKKEYRKHTNSLIQNRGHCVRHGYYNDSLIRYTTGSSGTNPGQIYITRDYCVSGILDSTWNNGSCLSRHPNDSGDIYYPVHSTFGYPINVDDTETIGFSGSKYGLLFDGDYDLRAPTIEQTIVGTSGHYLWLSGTYPDDWLSYVSTLDQYGVGRYSVNTQIQNKGFLFYNTAENLPSYYSISYKVSNSSDNTSNRFLYKIVLNSEANNGVVPSIKSIKFIANEDI